MIILHGALRDGGLLVWGECPLPADGGLQPGLANERRHSRSTPRACPYDAGADRLADALAQAGIVAGERTVVPAVAWLPSKSEQPVPSSPLIAELPASGKTRLLPWQVTAFAPGNEQVVELLWSS